MAFCVSCGEKLEDGAKFCSSCGQPVKGASVQTESAQEKSVIMESAPSLIRSDFGAPLEAGGTLKAHFKRGCSYNDKGHYDLAIAEFTTIIRRNPNDSVTFNRNYPLTYKLNYTKIV